MNKREKKERMKEIVRRLKLRYPEAVCALEYGGDPWRLLVMGRLSAQCTDARVNLVSRELFARFPDAKSMAEGDISEIEELVRPCGLYRMKAESIKAASKMLIEEFGGRLPDNMEDLLRFPGVGRKIANLLLGDVFGLPAVVCDTHCIRICGRLGMYPEDLKDPTRVEKILVDLLPPEESSDFCHRIVFFGREVCAARSPACSDCPLRDVCAHAAKIEKTSQNRASAKGKSPEKLTRGRGGES